MLLLELLIGLDYVSFIINLIHAHRLSFTKTLFPRISLGSPIIVPLTALASVMSVFTMGGPLSALFVQLLALFGLLPPIWAVKLRRFEHLLWDLVRWILHPCFLMVLTPVLVLRFHTHLDTKLI